MSNFDEVSNGEDMGDTKQKYLTIDEAAERSRIPVSTLRKRIAEGRLLAYKPGRHLLVDASELELFIKRTKVVSA